MLRPLPNRVISTILIRLSAYAIEQLQVLGFITNMYKDNCWKRRCGSYKEPDEAASGGGKNGYYP
ncbi:uncharacterized protein PHALS_15228 [Plasmopara halstedii]|uniref:Uncharacterized protein n=1 Tax=Plasmopara halstedii TaxID=4781 RepID=A0A0P1B673_PLAHL|nr:uncharacterized protein PHALS_15228 [Plasmopara halstedii]CEG49720.1 hypothetical protein PHALS_15228 [Plasmopara halstedii]|eukprot:XP_024586089.1 hypothetical protein PHALS_15228 [Plasmopara halstedii]